VNPITVTTDVGMHAMPT